jgi:hypothetical protein
MAGKTLEELAEEYLSAYREILERAREDPEAVRYELVRAALVYSDRRVLVERLRELARMGGCVSCAHSRPCGTWPLPECRWCELGLSQGACGRWEPLR